MLDEITQRKIYCLGLEESSGMCSRNIQHLETEQGGEAIKGDKERMTSEGGGRPGVCASQKSRFIFLKDFKNKKYHIM